MCTPFRSEVDGDGAALSYLPIRLSPACFSSQCCRRERGRIEGNFKRRRTKKKKALSLILGSLGSSAFAAGEGGREKAPESVCVGGGERLKTMVGPVSF